MAYMHELVHICHLDVRFFGNLHGANSYHASFVSGMVYYVLMFEKDWFYAYRNGPEEEKCDKKIFFEYNGYMIKIFRKFTSRT